MRFSLLVFLILPILFFQNCSYKSSEPTNSGASSTFAGSSIFGFNKLLWIGAHPDDEIPSSAFLREFCRESGKSCFIVSLTKGEAGQCKLAGGCFPNLASLRTSEFLQSGQYLGAQAMQKNYADGASGTKDSVLSGWAAAAGSSDNLVADIRNLIIQVDPDVILTFDPRHGTTCHADHRATGDLAVVAAQAAGFPLYSIFLVESVIAGVGGSSSLGFRPAAPGDTKTQTFTAGNSWEHLTFLMDSVYKSQYSSAEVSAMNSLPNEGRTLSILSASEATTDDPRYDSLCP